MCAYEANYVCIWLHIARWVGAVRAWCRLSIVSVHRCAGTRLVVLDCVRGRSELKRDYAFVYSNQDSSKIAVKDTVARR